MLDIIQACQKLKKINLYTTKKYGDLTEILDSITIHLQNNPDEADKYRGSVQYVVQALSKHHEVLPLKLMQAELRVSYEVHGKLCLSLLESYLAHSRVSNSKVVTLYDAFKTHLPQYRQPTVQDVYKYFVMQYWESMKLARVDHYIDFYNKLMYSYNKDMEVNK